MKKLFILFAFWLFWGFALGTFILLVPVRHTTSMAHIQHWAKEYENLVIVGYMCLLMIGSFYLAKFSKRVVLKAENTRNRKLVHTVLPVLLASISLYLFLNLALIHADTNTGIKELTNGFTIGPYPEAEKLKDLKKSGYAAVITLLHPAVVPFEPKLLDEEIRNGKRIGIKIISIPMLPWVGSNATAIEKLRKIVGNAKGKYYVHCYLGKDRVNVARRVILQETTNTIKVDTAFGRRYIDEIREFERGNIYKMGDSAYYTPMPTKEEYFRYVIGTDFMQVVSFTDFSSDEEKATLAQERKWLHTYRIPLKVYDITGMQDSTRIAKLVDSVKRMGRPLLIHAYRTDNRFSEVFHKRYNSK